MNIIPTSIAAHGKTCIGCTTNSRDVMISAKRVVPDVSDPYIDNIFLTKEQALQLVIQIQERLFQNQEYDQAHKKILSCEG